MTWHNLPTLTTGNLLTESHLSQIRDNIEHLGGMYAGVELLSALSAGANLQAPDYDSGWFAVTHSANYTYAHGLGIAPAKVILLHATSTTPTGSELVRVGVVYDNTAPANPRAPIGADATNIYATTGNSGITNGTVFSRRRISGSGAWKILAWK